MVNAVYTSEKSLRFSDGQALGPEAKVLVREPLPGFPAGVYEVGSGRQVDVGDQVVVRRGHCYADSIWTRQGERWVLTKRDASS